MCGQQSVYFRLHDSRAVACGLQGCASEAVQEVEEGQRKVSETWLVLEYCSKGSLQDALDRSACASTCYQQSLTCAYVLQHVAAVGPLLLIHAAMGCSKGLHVILLPVTMGRVTDI